MADVSQLLSKNKNKIKEKSKSKVKNTTAKKLRTHKIPQQKLEEALKVLKDEEQINLLFKQGVNCVPPIHLAGEAETHINPMMLLLKDMRTCLLQRDWRNLAELLVAADPRADSYRGLNLGLLAKYVTILTAYNDQKLMGLFSQSVLLEDDAVKILHKNTKYP